MRPIKFRAWHIKEKRMIHIENFHQIPSNWEDIWALMQFIGFPDKNGKEIFEGNIIKMYPWTDDSEQDVIWTGVVLWNKGVDDDLNPNGFYSFLIHSLWNGTDYSDPDSYGKVLPIAGEFVEIIGNIYENPELLEKIYAKSY